MLRVDMKGGLFETETLELIEEQAQRRKRSDLNPNLIARNQDKKQARYASMRRRERIFNKLKSTLIRWRVILSVKFESRLNKLARKLQGRR